MNKEILISWRNEFYPVKPSKIYEDYGIAITKVPNYIKGNHVYTLTDIETGLSCGKSFTKLSDAKSFMDHTEEPNFRIWFKAVCKARLGDSYKVAVQRRKDAEV